MNLKLGNSQSINNEANLSSLRWAIVLALILISLFAVADIGMLPEKLHGTYLFSRFVLQFPMALGYLFFTFHPRFRRHQHSSAFVLLMFLNYANFWLIQQSWLIAGVNFPYEGNLLYCMFAFFVLRLSFKFAIYYVLFVLLGFGTLVFLYPVYGDMGVTYFGFTLATLLICLIGLHTVLLSLNKAQALAEELEILSNTDQLSGLLNRRAYEREADNFMSEMDLNSKAISVYLIDLDDFKHYNDTFGHQEGDKIIQIQSNMLREIFRRETDIVGRYGGEEFVVIAGDTDKKKAIALAKNILTKWGKYNENCKTTKQVTCSIGIASVAKNGPDVDLKKLISVADKQLYKAKDEGKNCFRVKVISE